MDKTIMIPMIQKSKKQKIEEKKKDVEEACDKMIAGMMQKSKSTSLLYDDDEEIPVTVKQNDNKKDKERMARIAAFKAAQG